MKTLIFIKTQAHFTKSFKKETTDITLRWLKTLKINKFIMLRLPEAMENEVMWIKIVCFGVRIFQNCYIVLWDF